MIIIVFTEYICISYQEHQFLWREVSEFCASFGVFVCSKLLLLGDDVCNCSSNTWNILTSVFFGIFVAQKTQWQFTAPAEGAKASAQVKIHEKF